MQWATAFYANHSRDCPMDAHWSENAKYCFFYRKVQYFLVVIIVSRTYHINYKLVSDEY